MGLRPATVVAHPHIPLAKPPFSGLRAPQALYQLPKATHACLRRKTRKEVLMALTRGKGVSAKAQKKRKYNNESTFKC